VLLAPVQQLVLAVSFLPFQTTMELAIVQLTSSSQPIQLDIAKNVLIIVFHALVLHHAKHALPDSLNFQMDLAFAPKETMLIKLL